MPRHLSRKTLANPNNALSGLSDIYELQKFLLRALKPLLPSISNVSHGASSADMRPLPMPYLQSRVGHGVVAQRSPSLPLFPNDLSPQSRSRSSYQSTHLSNSHASIHVLPPEILGEIFMFCAESDVNESCPFNLPSARHPPMLMCQVCRYWRSIILSMPMIWASLTTRCRSYRQSDLPLYKMWLGRSCLAPLWLEISELDKEDSPDFLCVDAIFTLLISEIHRWRFVRLWLETQHLFDHFLAIPDNGATMLNGLELDVARESNIEGRLSTLLSAIPKFRALQQFSLAAASRLPSLMAVPWQQMTHIKISAPLLASDCVDILARCRLVVDVFLGQIKRESTEVTSDSISLPYLRSMTLITSCDPALLLRHLTLPLLTRMRIHDQQYGDFRDHAAFDEFMRRTPQLKHLVIEDIFCWVEQILAYFNMGSVQCVPDVSLRVSEQKYFLLRGHPDMVNKKFKVDPHGLRYYIGWTSQLDMGLRNDNWKRAFWDHEEITL